MPLVPLRLCCCILGFTLLAGLTSSDSFATTFYVAGNGNDAWSGNTPQPNAEGTDGPLASLAGARDAVRKLKAKGPLAEAVHVVVADGTYALADTLTFEPQDSGTPETPITFEAAEGAKPIFSGGRTVSGFTPAENGLWKVHLPEVAAGKWYFEDLFVNGRRAIRARSPNEFYYYVLKSIPSDQINPMTRQPGGSQTEFLGDPKDIAPLADVPKEHLNDAMINAFYVWDNAVLRVKAVDAASGRVSLTGSGGWPFDPATMKSCRYQIENIKSALDAPGEWFLDRGGDLFYMPLPGEDMTKAEVVAPALSGLIRFNGDFEKGRFIENLAFRGLSFQHDQCPLPAKGYPRAQAAWNVPSAIMADGTKRVAFENCSIRHVGGYAVWFRWGCQECRVARCLIEDMGAGGVRVGQGHDTGHCIVDNNIIRSGGHRYAGAVGAFVGDCPNNEVTHNDISDFRYTGISVGWVWGYGPCNGHHNKIEFNHIHHLGWGIMSDMGGVYTLGISPGTIVSNNWIHDIYSYDYGGWGLYTDEGSTGIVMENNLVYNVKCSCFHQHYGRENVIRNNIFAFATEAQLQRTRIEEHLVFTFSNNIVYWSGSPLFYPLPYRQGKSGFNDPNLKMDHNLYYDASGKPVLFDDMDLAAWQATGHDEGSIVADPKFVDPAHYDFHLQADSPASQIGFKPFDYTQAGVYGDDAWRKEAASIVYPPVKFAPDPPKP